MTPDALQAQVYRWVDEEGNAHYTVLRGELGARSQRDPTAASKARPAPPATETRHKPKPPATSKAAPEPTPPVAVNAGPAAPAPAAKQPADPVAQLESLIARDKETLKDLISLGRPTGEDLAANPRLREIAERLPRLQAQLRALRGAARH